MTKTTSAKKKFKKCLRINTVLANVGECVSGHLWLRFVLNDGLKECQSLRRQQVFLSGMARLVGEKKTDEAFGDGGIKVVFNEVGPVF